MVSKLRRGLGSKSKFMVVDEAVATEVERWAGVGKLNIYG